MFLPDLRTIFLLLVLVNLVSTVVMILMWNQYHDRYKGTAYWISDMACQTLSTLLIASRGNIPEWVSVVLANTLSVAGLIFGLKGLQEFLGIRSRQIHNLLFLFLFALIHTWFTIISPDLSLRYLNTATFSLLIFLQCSWLTLRSTPQKMKELTRGIGIVFIIFSIVSIARLFKFFLIFDHGDNYFQAGVFESGVMIMYLLLIVIVTYSLALMYSRRLLQDIKSEEAKFSTAFRTSPYGLIITRMSDGLILEVNDGFETITGYTREFARNNTTLQLDLWNDLSDRKYMLDTLHKNGFIYEKEFRFRKVTGELLTCLFSAKIITINNDVCVLSSVSDITQRVNDEEKLRRSEKSLADAERISHSGSWVYDIATDTSEWSENMFNIFDVDRSNPIELKYSEFIKNIVHPQDKDHVMSVLENALAGIGEYDLVYRIIKKDGRIRHIQSIAETLRDKDNNPYRMSGKVQDITEQKISNDYLKSSEEKFRNLFENSPLGKTITGLDGTMQVNSSFCKMIGYSADELINANWKKISHPDDIEKTDYATHLLLSGKRDRIRIEKRYIHKLGAIVYTDVSTYLHRGTDGKPQYYIATIIDITERILLERERFRLLDILDQSINEIYLFKSDTLKFDYVNAGALKNLGYSIEEIRLLTPLDIKPEFTEKTFRSFIDPLITGNKGSLVFETFHRRKNGTDYPVEVHLQLFRRDEDSLFFAIILDITERILNEQKITKLNEELELRVIERTEMLRISQKNYQEIFEISPVSIWKEDWKEVISEIKRIKNEEGVTDFKDYIEANPSFVNSALDSVKVLDVNPAAMTLFGASDKSQLLQSLKVLFSTPDLLPGFIDELVALGSGVNVFEADIALRKLDNEIIYVLLRMVFPPEDSDSGIVLVNVADITFRKKAQQALEESQQKLLVTNKELEAFTYTVSHDLRAPLRAIDGFSKILTEDYKDRLDADGERVINVIRENTMKMSNLIDDLLSFARLGKSQVNISMTNMHVLIDSAYNDLVSSREPVNIKFVTGEIHNIVCDRIMIRQVWTNLISNALKFSSGREKTEISILSYIENRTVVYTISDNGVGFDMKYYGKLFGVFERLHNSVEFEGTGVGLAIVERIIKKHGGKVWAEGKPGIGATFFFSLPIRKEVVGSQD